MGNTTRLTRQQLYDLVWQKAISRLVVEDFAISGVGLAKLCKRYDIPTPPRGYWAQHQAGQKLRRPALPRGNDSLVIELPGPPTHEEPAQVRREIAQEKEAERQILVPERLHAPCSPVSAAKAALDGAQTDQQGLARSPEGGLVLRVSRQLQPRALRIADAWIKALVERGWRVAASGRCTHADFVGVDIGFSIEESLTTEQRELPSDLASGSYSFHYRRQETVRKPSGRLTLALHEQPTLWSQMRRKWHDSETRSLDTQLNVAFVGLLRLAVAVREQVAQREEAERKEVERQRHAQLALEEQKRLRAGVATEKSRVEMLRRQAASWRESEQVRQFVAEARARGELRALGLRDGALEQWSAWALEQADRMDPFVESPRSILDDETRIEKMCDHITWRR